MPRFDQLSVEPKRSDRLEGPLTPIGYGDDDLAGPLRGRDLVAPPIFARTPEDKDQRRTRAAADSSPSANTRLDPVPAPGTRGEELVRLSNGSQSERASVSLSFVSPRV